MTPSFCCPGEKNAQMKGGLPWHARSLCSLRSTVRRNLRQQLDDVKPFFSGIQPRLEIASQVQRTSAVRRIHLWTLVSLSHKKTSPQAQGRTLFFLLVFILLSHLAWNDNFCLFWVSVRFSKLSLAQNPSSESPERNNCSAQKVFWQTLQKGKLLHTPESVTQKLTWMII